MKKKIITLEIPTPCHEKYENMDKVEVGHFCHSCQKNVIDFRGKLPSEIAHFFHQNKDANTCGTFYQHQLEQEYEFYEPSKKGNLKYAAGLLVGMLLAQNNFAKPPLKGKIVAPIQQVKTGEINIEDIENTTLFKGFVYEANTKKPIHLVNIYVVINGVSKSLTSSNTNGNFEFRLTENELNNGIISFQAYHHQHKIKEIKADKLKVESKIYLTPFTKEELQNQIPIPGGIGVKEQPIQKGDIEPSIKGGMRPQIKNGKVTPCKK